MTAEREKGIRGETMKLNFAITNPERVVFPKEAITKMDVIRYYLSVADKMLPFLKSRPLSVVRCHDGIQGSCFFRKHPETDEHVEAFSHRGERWFYLKNASQLAYQAQMGTVEIHTWNAKVKKFHSPDRMVFDLDPDGELPLTRLREGVSVLKDLLTKIGLVCFLKTSGGKGYHVVVPFSKCKSAERFYTFSKEVAQTAAGMNGGLFTVNSRKAERKGKIFLDYMRNQTGATCVAPYSLRARDGAPISMPIAWEDLHRISPNAVTLFNYEEYLSDAWDDFFSVKQELR